MYWQLTPLEICTGQRKEINNTPNVDVMKSTLRLTWVNFLRRDELQACLGEFDLDIAGTVQEMRRRWAQFINQDHRPDVVPPSYARNVADEVPTNEKGFPPIDARISNDTGAEQQNSTGSTNTNQYSKI
ncbi:hypothetical protein GQX74_010153 [Glossina fuscipes]|nr:hypothetical protein GQX74_010153 [Glossina fuscipes]